MLLSPFTPFPVARPSWSDPFSDPFADMLSPFSLLPSLTRSLDAFPARTRIEAGPDKSLKVVFSDLDGYEKIDVSVDEKTNAIMIRASNEQGSARASRSVVLPCALQSCEKITAESKGGRVIVTVPEESQKAPAQSSLAEMSQPLRVTLRPAESKAPTPEFETSHDEVGFTIKVIGVAKEEDPRVEVDSNKLLVSCKSADGNTFSRVFALPRNVKDPQEILAKLEEDRLVVSVPEHALEVKKEPVKAQINIKKA